MGGMVLVEISNPRVSLQKLVEMEAGGVLHLQYRNEASEIAVEYDEPHLVFFE